MRPFSTASYCEWLVDQSFLGCFVVFGGVRKAGEIRTLPEAASWCGAWCLVIMLPPLQVGVMHAKKSDLIAWHPLSCS
jgi:hypothetical protein